MKISQDTIDSHGIKKDQNFLMIVIGKNIHLNKLFQKMLPNLIKPFSNNNSVIIKNHYTRNTQKMRTKIDLCTTIMISC